MQQIPEKTIRARIIERLKNRAGGAKFSMVTMIDIVFLLLVFFIATGRFRPNEGKLPMQVPPHAGGEASELSIVEPLVIGLDSQDDALAVSLAGRVYTYEPVSSAALIGLSDELTAVYAAQRRSLQDPIELDCSDELLWEHLVRFYNLMYGMGITNITFVLAGV